MVSGATSVFRDKLVRCAAVFAALAVVVAVQLSWGRIQEAFGFGGPSAAQAAQQLGLRVVDHRQRAKDYRRGAFGEAWTDDTDAPLGHNGCDTRFISTQPTSRFAKGAADEHFHATQVADETMRDVGDKQGALSVLQRELP